MKKILFLILALVAIATTAGAQVEINAKNFPDTNFRNWLLSQDYGKDGKLTDAEIKAVTVMNCDNKGIAILTGIEHFTALQYLRCGSNKLSTLDVSKNTKLIELHCTYNQLSALDLFKNPELTTLMCQNNRLTKLDLSNNTKLRLFECYNNQLVKVVMPKYPKLTRVYCYGNQIQGDGMQALVNGLPKVTEGEEGKLIVINAKDSKEQNVITKPQVAIAKNKGWKVYDRNGDSPVEYAGAGIAIDNTNFPSFFLNYVLTNLDPNKDGYLIPSEIAAVTNINVFNWSIADLKGIEHFTALKVLDCHQNKLKSLDLSKNTELTTLYCYDNQLTSLNVTGCTELTDLRCYNNQLKSLDVLKNTKLTMLRCYNNQLTSLDASKNTALTMLYCYDNQLTSLNVTGCTALTDLQCYNNQLKSIDVSKNTKLTTLSCRNNQLTSLDVTKNTALTKLYCYSNQIKGDKMQTLVNSLPKVSSGNLYVINTKDNNEGNVITKSQVAIAKNKGWKVYDRNGGSVVEYAGSDDTPTGIAINATNFPDANFRNFVSGVTIDKDKNGYLSDAEIAAVKEMDVNNKNIANLKGIEHFTALENLYCQGNPLKSLDVSKNTKLKGLYSFYNELTELDVSKNTNLTSLTCYRNQISGDKMQALVESLPKVASGNFSVFKLDDEKEKNVITKSQVALAKSKGWKVWACEQTGDEYKWYEYAGSDPGSDPIPYKLELAKGVNIVTSLSDYAVIRLAMEKTDVFTVEDGESSTVLKSKKTGKTLMTAYEAGIINVPDDVTSADNIEFDITAADHAQLKSWFEEDPLKGYDKVTLSFVALTTEDFIISFPKKVNTPEEVNIGEGTMESAALYALVFWEKLYTSEDDETGNVVVTTMSGKDLFMIGEDGVITVFDDVNSADNIVYTITDKNREDFKKEMELPIDLFANYKTIQIKFEFGTMGIGAPLNDNGQMTNDSWYTIDGKKLNGEPTKKGVYIIKGKKVKR